MSAGRNNTNQNKSWNTPPKYVDVISKFFDNEIDLDPCSNEYSLVQSKTKFILPQDGLKEDWISYKNIFINPPYGRDKERKTSIYNWVNKSYDTFLNGSEVILLIPVATNTKHFKEIIFKYANSVCFLSDTRLKFWINGMEFKKGCPMSCCIVYFGNDTDKFFSIFNEYGKCLKINF